MQLTGTVVKVEVVNHRAALVRGHVDVEFEQERDDAAGKWRVGGKAEDDVAVGLEEVEEQVWR
jgi:hypothetical protein